MPKSSKKVELATAIPSAIEGAINRRFSGIEQALEESLARSAGEYHGQFVKQFVAAAQAAEGDFSLLALNGLRELATAGSITAREASQITEFISWLLKGESIQLAAVRDRSRNLREQFITSKASPAAIAIAGVAVSSFQSQTDTGAGTRARLPKFIRVGMADVGGAIVGAVFGSVVPGVGTVTGAISGGALGSGIALTAIHLG